MSSFWVDRIHLARPNRSGQLGSNLSHPSWFPMSFWRSRSLSRYPSHSRRGSQHGSERCHKLRRKWYHFCIAWKHLMRKQLQLRVADSEGLQYAHQHLRLPRIYNFWLRKCHHNYQLCIYLELQNRGSHFSRQSSLIRDTCRSLSWDHLHSRYFLVSPCSQAVVTRIAGSGFLPWFYMLLLEHLQRRMYSNHRNYPGF